jgi:hypothetical protein
MFNFRDLDPHFGQRKVGKFFQLETVSDFLRVYEDQLLKEKLFLPGNILHSNG